MSSRAPLILSYVSADPGKSQMFVWTTEGEAGQVSLIVGNDENQLTLAPIPESRLGFVC